MLDSEPSSLRFFLEILQPFQPELLVPFIILLVLLLLSALVSGSEVAFFSLKAQDIEGLKAKQKNLYETLYDLLDKPKTLLGTILIANNFINVGIVILSAFITDALFDFSEYPQIGFAVQVIAITFILLLFGEVLPKVYASKNPLGFSTFMSRPMQILRQLFKPLSVVLVKSSGLIERRLKSNTENLSVDDLSQALEISSQESATAEDQRILEGIVKFGSTTVKQIMKSRLDVTCVDEQWDYEKVLDVILESGYSRIPVYQDNFDTIKGVLYIKDLLPHISEEPSFKWTELIRDSFFVPENKKIDDLLKEFQEKKIHLAVVADEFGGTSGIITLEDVIEEIVGEISDEFDDEELVYSKLDDLNYVFEGKIHFTDFLKVVNANEEEFEEHRAEADTLAGFLLEISGKFPEKNEEILFNDYIFTVESLEGRRINRIKVTLQPKEEEND